MRVSEVETSASGEVVRYSCPECDSALVMERAPQHTVAVFRCVNCEQETTTPTPDPGRTAERLYSVRVEIAWNDQRDGDILCEAEELKCFDSERAAREYVCGLFYAVFDAAGRDDAKAETPSR